MRHLLGLGHRRIAAIIEQQRLAIAKARDAAERKLLQVEHQLDRLGPLSRRRSGATLRAEIALARTAIRMSEGRLTDLDRQGRELRGSDVPQEFGGRRDRRVRPVLEPSVRAAHIEAPGVDL